LQVVYCVVDTGLDNSNPDLSFEEVTGCMPNPPTTTCAQWNRDTSGGATRLLLLLLLPLLLLL
jgi:hypothetical protein